MIDLRKTYDRQLVDLGLQEELKFFVLQRKETSWVDIMTCAHIAYVLVLVVGLILSLTALASPWWIKHVNDDDSAFEVVRGILRQTEHEIDVRLNGVFRKYAPSVFSENRFLAFVFSVQRYARGV